MWNGISAGSLQESGLLHWEHWNRCCHKLDHEPYGRPWWKLEQTHTKHKKMCQKSGLLYSLFALLSGSDFAAPLVLPGCSSGAGTTPTESVSEEHLETIVSMGFSRDQATKALRATVRFKGICHGCSEVRSGQFITEENEAAQQISRRKSKTEAILKSTQSPDVNVWLNLCVCQSNVLQRAVDWIFSHMDDLECMDISEGGRSAADSESARESVQGPNVRDGPGSKFSSEGWEICFLWSLGN